jgi:antirestriction protein
MAVAVLGGALGDMGELEGRAFMEYLSEYHGHTEGAVDDALRCWPHVSMGEHEDEMTYAWEYIDDIGLLAGTSDEVARYFDAESWARDNLFQHGTMRTVGHSPCFLYDPEGV